MLLIRMFISLLNVDLEQLLALFSFIVRIFIILVDVSVSSIVLSFSGF